MRARELYVVPDLGQRSLAAFEKVPGDLEFRASDRHLSQNTLTEGLVIWGARGFGKCQRFLRCSSCRVNVPGGQLSLREIRVQLREELCCPNIS